MTTVITTSKRRAVTISHFAVGSCLTDANFFVGVHLTRKFSSVHFGYGSAGPDTTISMFSLVCLN